MSSNLFQFRQRATARGRSLPFLVVIALAVLLCECSMLQAAPVTFAFEAEVEGIVVISKTDLVAPFQLAIGDLLNGRFTFEPTTDGDLTEQVLGLRFDVGNTTLMTDIYQIDVENDGFILRDDGFGNTQRIEPVDFIGVSCASTGSISTECNPGVVPEAEGWRWSALVGVSEGLSGTGNIITTDALSGDVGDWNAFPIKQWEIALRYYSPASSLNPSGTIVYSGPIDALTVVPEPSAIWIFVSCLVLLWPVFQRNA